jgi:hypothetical protein
MKPTKLFATMIVATAMLFVYSCNSEGEKKADETTADSTTVTTETTTPVTPSVMPGPTNMMVIKHKVANYAKWKPGFDAHDSARLANGLHKYVIGRGIEDSNMVLVALRMDDINKAKEVGASPDLKARMKKAGVTGVPDIDYTESVFSDTTPVQTAIRLQVSHKVKDWDAWKKVFDAHKQARMDAGLIDRVVAHTIGDPKAARLVFAVSDMEKAKAFINSQELKDRMAEGGVEGKPSFFFFTVVQRN